MASCLVTGGAGFIGSHLTERLCAEGHNVRVLDNLSGGAEANLSKVKSKVKFFKGDIQDPLLLKKALEGVEFLFHEAAVVSVGESIRDPKKAWNVNVEGSKMLLESAEQAGVRNAVLASSAAIYGLASPPLSESFAGTPLSPYGESKLEMEKIASGFSNSGLKTICLRYFNVYGPRQSFASESGVISRFVDALCSKKPIVIYGDGTQTRDFIYVADVIEANIAAMKKDNVNGKAFNVATGSQTSLNELHTVISRLLHTKAKVKYDSWRPGDIKFSFADVTKARDILGFKAKWTLERGLKETIKWRKNL